MRAHLLLTILCLAFLVQGRHIKTAQPKNSKINRIHEDTVFNKIVKYAEWESEKPVNATKDSLKSTLVFQIMQKLSLRRRENRPDLFNLEED